MTKEEIAHGREHCDKAHPREAQEERQQQVGPYATSGWSGTGSSGTPPCEQQVLNECLNTANTQPHDEDDDEDPELVAASELTGAPEDRYGLLLLDHGHRDRDPELTEQDDADDDREHAANVLVVTRAEHQAGEDTDREDDRGATHEADEA